MIVTYIRSSLLGSFDLCEQQTFIQYNLGYYNEPNVKTVVGTMTHKVMEILSCLKKAYQDTRLYSYEDADFGLLSFKEEDFLKETVYSFEEVESVNKERIDKDFYIDIPRLKMPYSRIGREIVENLILMVYNYYVGKNTHIKFLDKHFQWCRNCTWLLLENKNYDPRLRDIVAPEGPFDLEIDEPWSDYTYLIGDKRVSSKLRIKGTIDLVTKIDDETYEIIDLKTGKRHDWAKEEEKTYAKLCKDKQLMLYYYAARRVYPNIKTLLLTINYVRHGGAYTISIDDESIKETLGVLKQAFNKIRATEYPKLLDYYHKHFLCRMCTFFKTKIDGESQCSNIMKFNKKNGMAKTIEKYKAPGFNLDRYQSPGE